ncbi:CaiB/BaiF CoA-transferase family protein [Microbacterium sp.]|uniref:CaiB/BaiF CoA transferase family protein n=1 Tax=Microbacterium sp. TaxID=51671 RepID=UPI0025F25BF1|nr:CaiB/BaiF CoA-transferase family protein [Microbacterium sp.]
MSAVERPQGPLNGVRIIELSGIGPGPFAGMLLADLGAEVIRVDRATGGSMLQAAEPRLDVLGRGKRSIAVDLKNADGVATVLDLIAGADAVFEGYRPGVAERLGLGPEVCLARNPAVVFGRMTGWGQTGPMASAAGHDIDYISIAGALHPIGRAGEPPTPPLNLVGDFGGGGVFLAFGMVCAILSARTTGVGQVVDAAMVDGASILMAPFVAMRASGMWRNERGTNILDSGAPFYDAYRTADGGYLSVGAIEPQFYAALLEGLGLAGEELPGQMDRETWPVLKARFAEIIGGRTRDEWTEVFAGTDACVAPVLEPDEVPENAHMKARESFVDVAGLIQPRPAPRFSVTPPADPAPARASGQDTRSVLADLGYSADRVEELLARGAIAEAISA